ncbi:MAG: hypothetical protein LBE20_07510 [Deltaproteobacteria bacterium]|jgi:hypothetical protein|nr:hypothetical protein [Deltaproteobacteria bacterium]
MFESILKKNLNLPTEPKQTTGLQNRGAGQTESQHLTNEGQEFINRFLQASKKALDIILNSQQKDNTEFSLLKMPDLSTTSELTKSIAFIAKAMKQEVEEIRQDNIKQLEEAKKVIEMLSELNPDIKKEILVMLSQTNSMGLPISQTANMIMQYARLGADRVMEEFNKGKTTNNQEI